MLSRSFFPFVFLFSLFSWPSVLSFLWHSIFAFLYSPNHSVLFPCAVLVSLFSTFPLSILTLIPLYLHPLLAIITTSLLNYSPLSSHFLVSSLSPFYLFHSPPSPSNFFSNSPPSRDLHSFPSQSPRLLYVALPPLPRLQLSLLI